MAAEMVSLTDRVENLIGGQINLSTRDIIILTQLVALEAPVIGELENYATTITRLEKEITHSRKQRNHLQIQLQEKLRSILRDPDRYGGWIRHDETAEMPQV